MPSNLGETFEFIEPEGKVLCIGEYVSKSPQTHAGFYESKNWEMSSTIKKYITDNDKVLFFIFRF